MYTQDGEKTMENEEFVPMPEELRKAYETFNLLCIKHNVCYAALAIRRDPLTAFLIGNMRERGSALADILRQHADIVEAKAAPLESIKGSGGDLLGYLM